MRALFTLTLFLSSFLLFLVEPMVAKMILPTFGGSPQVWNTSLVFFQGVLLLGYLYAHVGARRIGLRRAALLHMVLMGAVLVVLIALPMSSSNHLLQEVRSILSDPKADGTQPQAMYVFIALAGLVGLPFFVVSSGAPLLQRWFAHTDDPAAKDPYFLYSASNIGSMLGLFAYPFILEPSQTLGEQGRLWQFAYACLFVLMAACAFLIYRMRDGGDASTETAEPSPSPVTTRMRVHWLLLAAVPSSLLLAVTTYLTTNVAPMPLLWVVPLAIYLLSFILAFAKWGAGPLPILQRLLPLIATPLALAIILESAEPIVPLAIFHLAVFFVAAWMCHGKLAASRPDRAHLTEFYLYLSLGGVIGGAFNALLAPILFNGLYEYPIALVLACLLRGGFELPRLRSRWDYFYPALVVVVGLIAFYGAEFAHIPLSQLRSAVVIGLPLVFCFFAVDHIVRFGLSYGAVFLTAFLLQTSSPGAKVVLTMRSFFGVSRVLAIDHRWYKLAHGNTVHGMQDRQNPHRPLTYYYPTGPIGLVMNAYGDRLKNVALVGLGVGSIAAYGRPGQHYTYFEIDPTVVYIARDSGLFTFLRDSKAKVDYVVGDARLTLARSPGGYDLIVLDAFSSDSIPIHLLTREAIQMYVSKLAPGGFLAFHISNKYLELGDVLATTAKSLHLGAEQDIDGPMFGEAELGKTQSDWMILARSENDLIPLQENKDWQPFDISEEVRPWTDDYSNVLSAVRLNQ